MGGLQCPGGCFSDRIGNKCGCERGLEGGKRRLMDKCEGPQWEKIVREEVVSAPQHQPGGIIHHRGPSVCECVH